MSDKVKERIEKELYNHIDIFTGNREVHTPTLVNAILKMFEAERPKAWNEAIDACVNAIIINHHGISPTMLETLQSQKI